MSLLRERDAGMTQEVSDYLKTAETDAAKKVLDLIFSHREFERKDEFEELQAAIEVLKEEIRADS